MQLDQAAEHRRQLKLIDVERLRRRLRQTERESLICYIKRIWPWFIVEEVHLLIAAYLEALAAGELDRLMIFMPPRAGQSAYLMGIFFASPPFFFGKVSCSTPSLYSASVFAWPMSWARLKLRNCLP